MTEYTAQLFNVTPDIGYPYDEIGVRKLDQSLSPVAQLSFGDNYSTYFSFESIVGGSMTEHMLIDANGNVGIGAASSGEKLEVAGTIKATAFNGNGLNLTNLNGSQITTGTIADARLPLSISRTVDIDARFDPSTGHKHTGAAGDGSQISHSTLTNIAGADPGSTDAQTNKHVSNAQTKVWQDHAGITSGNPHGTTAAQVGALASVEGVSNPGGNIDLVNSNAITISGNNTTKQVTIGETHSARTDNPHATTAAQIGAPVSVEGVSNPGGNIDLVNSNTITIAGNNTTKQITIGETHSARTDNPHATTAAQVGAPVSIEGVTNAGGDIDLVNSNAITIAGNNTTKQITIGETHSARTDNPHATTAAQIDNQGGTNRITTQINAGTGTINEARIDAAIARDSEVSAKFDITSGHDHDGVDSKKIPALSSTYFGSLDGSGLTNLNGSQITTGTVPLAQIPATLTGKDTDTLDGQHGSYYRNASNLNAGTVPLAQIPATLTGKTTDSLTMRGEASAGNAGSITVTNYGNNILSLNLGNVTAGDRIFVTAEVDIAKGATSGHTEIGVAKTSDSTAAIQTLNTSGGFRQQCYVSSGQYGMFLLSGVIRIITGGTLSLLVYGYSWGSNSVIPGAGYAQISAFFLKKL